MGIGAGGWQVVRWRGMVYVGLIVGSWWSGGFELCVDGSDVPCWRTVGQMELQSSPHPSRPQTLFKSFENLRVDPC